ncbi:MAG TPA: phosphoribosylaminoimidazolesuccinocarboxamide synthase [Dehalococcoidia bacterium]|nr:phosphoribosylaminoimidazolesuccinocarboxamide synthase [Dehalococcoidia bacterium]
MTTEVLLQSNLDLPLTHRGKVRDTYDLGDKLLIVTTDRISAFDVVLPNGIPDKGRVLTQLSAFWFQRTGDVVPNHFVRLVDSTRIPEVPVELPPEVVGAAMVVRKALRLDIEAIVRGYTVLGSAGWAEYRKSGMISGVKLPQGLEEAQELPEPVFTPTSKAEVGHDENITWEQLTELVGQAAANAVKLRSLALYRYGKEYALDRGIIIADTKFEFGWWQDEIILIDEALTPDSSRFWPAEDYEQGRSQVSFDKQYVRDWLDRSGWNREPPPPELPSEVVQKTAEKYREAFQRLTGQQLVRP